MNIISPPPPESFAPDPTPTALELAWRWTINAQGWLTLWRQTRDPEYLLRAKVAGAEANVMAMKASTQDGGTR